ncbi:MAG TPA: hypothetical protein DDW52_07075 [Planctomycetaceae bacterium]|nr:hypothetical protein [Planctomycetaceae bacterium]
MLAGTHLKRTPCGRRFDLADSWSTSQLRQPEPGCRTTTPPANCGAQMPALKPASQPTPPGLISGADCAAALRSLRGDSAGIRLRVRYDWCLTQQT